MTHKDLEVWKRSMKLVKDVYQLSALLSEDEKYGLISQLNRAAVSIPANIAEGAGRSSSKEYIRFLDIATGSVSELETLLILSEQLLGVKSDQLINSDIKSIRVMLTGLKRSLKGKIK
ncbi:four helix bundle protein [Robertkochia aurantiaca]|uniref:four helix bundle protein n=1 Tax=Robertkochia aurantiaca TaxID=2873700 RepID=UPI001CCF12C8|nr:four helix bundle protein [Robertkochia sp. 3YJGBD-33]